MSAWWIRLVVIPELKSQSKAILGSDIYQRQAVLQMETLACTLETAARRKRQEFVFSPLIPRGEATTFAKAILERTNQPPGSTEPHLLAPDSVKQLAENMRKASDAKVGRRSLLSAERVDLIERRGRPIDERHRKRLKKQQREHDAWRDFFKRGGGLLGSNIPFPDI